MDRRKSLKSIVLGSVATGLAAHGCKPGEETSKEVVKGHEAVEWRTKYENEILQEIKSGEDFFNAHQRETMIILCDLILPPSDQYKGASDADVVSFIDFIEFRILDFCAKLITLIFIYKHNNYKHTYGKKCEKSSIILA